MLSLATLTFATKALGVLQTAIQFAPTAEALAQQFSDTNSAIQNMVAEGRDPSHQEWATLMDAQAAALQMSGRPDPTFTTGAVAAEPVVEAEPQLEPAPVVEEPTPAPEPVTEEPAA